MKKILFFATIFLLFGTSSFVFAWWDFLRVEEENVVLGIGDGVNITVELDSQTSGSLVPAGIVSQPNQVESIVLTYIVELENEVNENLLLEVFEENVQVGGNNSLGQYIGFDIILNSSEISNDPVSVSITVTLELTEAIVLNDGLDLDDFRNQNISFDLVFIATQQ